MWHPRQDSNLRSRLRRAVLYPLSYGGLSGPGRRSAYHGHAAMLTLVVRGRRWVGVVLLLTLLVGGTAACSTSQRPPEPAVMRTTPPPWDAPRDAVANIEEANLVAEPLDTTTNQRITSLEVVVDGDPVEVPANIGIDRIRALQAAAHTHNASGEVWLEGTEAPTVTLGQFFTLWGVRFDDDCLGSFCGTIEVTADGSPVTDPAGLVLAETRAVRVEVRSDN